IEAEISAAILGVLESEFISLNHEWFGDPALFERMQRREEMGTAKGPSEEENTTAWWRNGKLGAVGLKRLAGLESNMFGTALDYRQFVDALQALAGKVDPHPKALAPGRKSETQPSSNMR